MGRRHRVVVVRWTRCVSSPPLVDNAHLARLFDLHHLQRYRRFQNRIDAVDWTARLSDVVSELGFA